MLANATRLPIAQRTSSSSETERPDNQDSRSVEIGMPAAHIGHADGIQISLGNRTSVSNSIFFSVANAGKVWPSTASAAITTVWAPHALRSAKQRRRSALSADATGETGRTNDHNFASVNG